MRLPTAICRMAVAVRARQLTADRGVDLSIVARIVLGPGARLTGIGSAVPYRTHLAGAW